MYPIAVYRTKNKTSNNSSFGALSIHLILLDQSQKLSHWNKSYSNTWRGGGTFHPPPWILFYIERAGREPYPPPPFPVKSNHKYFSILLTSGNIRLDDLSPPPPSDKTTSRVESIELDIKAVPLRAQQSCLATILQCSGLYIVLPAFKRRNPGAGGGTKTLHIIKKNLIFFLISSNVTFSVKGQNMKKKSKVWGLELEHVGMCFILSSLQNICLKKSLICITRAALRTVFTLRFVKIKRFM